MLHTVLTNMFHLPLPWLEKVLRPMVMYVCLVLLLRLFGKRELAQLNPFDLVVLLTLSNTVQNAIIGDDNSVSGGLIGAVALLSTNWLLSRLLFRAPKLNEVLEGDKTVLITDGRVDADAMKREALTREDLTSVLNKNGYNRAEDVKLCVLEPNGNFYVEGMTPNQETVHSRELMDAVHEMHREIRELRAALAAKS